MNSRSQASSQKSDQQRYQFMKSIRKNNSEMLNQSSGMMEEIPQQSNIVQFQNPQPQSLGKNVQKLAQAIQSDPQLELVYLKEIVDYFQHLNMTPFGENVEAKDIRWQLKNGKVSATSILQLLIQTIDPQLEIKSFNDDRFQNFMKKFGYPQRLSKTRYQSLGSLHTMTQTLHLLRWIAMIGEMAHVTLDQRTTEENFDEHLERLTLQEFKNGTYRVDVVKQFTEEATAQESLKLQQLKQQTQMVNEQIQREKLTHPKLHIIEDDIQQCQMKHQGYQTQIKDLEAEINNIIEADEKINNKIIDQQSEMQANKQQIEMINRQLESQSMSYQQANELVQKTNNNNAQLKTYIEDVARLQDQNHLLQTSSINLQQRIEHDIFELNRIIENELNPTLQTPLQGIPPKFNIFERIPQHILLRETKNGIDDFESDEDLCGGNNLDMNETEFQQMVLLNRQNTKKRKSVQISDCIIKRDVKQTLSLMLPRQIRSSIRQVAHTHLTTLQEQITSCKNQLDQARQTIQITTHNLNDATNQKMEIEQKLRDLAIQESNDDTLRNLYAEYDRKHQQQIKEQHYLQQERLRLEEQLAFEHAETERLKEKQEQLAQIYKERLQHCEQLENQAQAKLDDLEMYTISLLNHMNEKIAEMNEDYNQMD